MDSFSPAFDQALGFYDHAEELAVESLAAELPVERFGEALLLWLSRLDAEGLHRKLLEAHFQTAVALSAGRLSE